jgi:hypothetical protein
VVQRRVFKVPLLAVIGLAIVAMLLLMGQGESQPAARAASCWAVGITDQWTDLDLRGSVLRVSVEGKVGLPVTVRSSGGYETVNLTGTKPEYGPYVAEFAPLSKGTYFIEPQGLGIVYQVWLDGRNYTRVDFRPQACAPTSTPTPRPPTATATRRLAATATPTRVLPTPTQPAQQAAGWQSRIVQRLENPPGSYWATIAVRVIGRPAGQDVEISAGGYSAICKTGTKPEHGPDACEFAGLHTDTYRLSPTGLGVSRDVAIEMGDFVLVEFYQAGGGGVTTRWVGSVVKNTSGSTPTDYTNSAIAVIVAGKPWHEVEIRSNGWSTTAQTGTKPDYGPDACEFGGLRAATYTITPKDLGASAQVTVDGWGWAMVRFDPVSVAAPQPTSKPTQAAQPTPKPTQTVQPTRTPTPGPKSTSQPSPTPAGSRWQGWVISNTSGQGDPGVWSVIIVRVINYGGWPVEISGGGSWSDTCITGSKPEYGADACSFGGLWAGTYYLHPKDADIELAVTMDGRGTAVVEFAHP